MSDNIYHPNLRIWEANRNGDRIATVTSVPKWCRPDKRVSIPRPMPGVIILVHGVNDVGEAYPIQAQGLCTGLNERLGRKDLTPGDWDVPRACHDNRATSYERRAERQGHNPIIPFYWGYRPVDKATCDADQARYRDELRRRIADPEAPYDAYFIDSKSDPRRGFENTDNHGNRLDKHYCKNGGTFANATTNLVDMWGPGGDIFGVVRWISTMGADLSHPIYHNPHRIYLVNAAQRLANLIIEIRDHPRAGDDSINIVAHSQGTLVAMLANFLVANADRPRRPADCLILNHSPYSLETPLLEAWQSSDPQQTRRARAETLANLCRLLDAHLKPGPDAEKLVHNGFASCEAAAKPNHVRDNHGKVFNYFCPHDHTVSLRNVQGIGWQGVPPAVSRRLGPAFAQRVFVEGRPMHSAPGPYALPDIDLPLENRDVPEGRLREIGAPQLPDLGYTFTLPAGCGTLGASDWGVHAAALGMEGGSVVTRWVDDPRAGAQPLGTIAGGALDDLQAAFRRQGKDWTLVSASKSERGLRITRLRTPEDFRRHAAGTETENSHHSAIVRDIDASRCAAAYDLAIGRCRSYDMGKLDGGPFWQKLLRMADWREAIEREDQAYYQRGLLPKEIKRQMNKPPCIPGIVNETRAYIKDRLHCREPLGPLPD